MTDMDYDKASGEAEYIVRRLNSDYEFYECDFEYEYTPFEESIKRYCDSYADSYILGGDGEIFFDSLAAIVEAVAGCDGECYDEDFFRPIELITYYFGRLIYSSDDVLKDKIYSWLVSFCDEYYDDMIVIEYFRPFLNGEKIYHADNYYTDYKDFNRMVLVNKK